ncbi:phage terminase large subunit [Defluviimonas aestuarii]|uniref:phage terminase large subunit n=1 Tax=Albidovulum aestuarii TaxID=1130726 RepID=UPI002499CE10|nr:phage terminase large subunit [Defluviimonas aestuarii]MDI3337934.1 phage terminase large subunit [Defluviimonas aestuarii]
MTPSDTLAALYFYNPCAFVERAFYELNPGAAYHYGHHIRAICYQLERVLRGETRRLLILMPPRHLKSHCVTVAFPAWVLGRDPTKRIVTISYGASLSETFSRQSRHLMLTEWYRAVFPDLQIDPAKASVEELLTTKAGLRLSTSIGGALTGKGGDMLIIDDPMKADEVASETRREAVWDWFNSTAVTRLNSPNEGAIIVVAQRLHEDDLAGRLIATGDWDVLELPAIETRKREIHLTGDLIWTRKPGEILLPDHMGRAELDQYRRSMGSRAFETQYQQAPVPEGGGIIKPEWFGAIPTLLRRCDYEAVIQSWDPAAVPGESNDFSVCTTWGLVGKHVDLLDVHRRQYLYPDLKKAAMTLRSKWQPDLIVVEAVGVGHSLYGDLRRAQPAGIRGSTPRKSKVERMSIQSAKIEAGEVRIRNDTPWCESFIAEAAAFPNGKYDDQVDSMSQALYALDCRLHELRHCSRFKG